MLVKGGPDLLLEFPAHLTGKVGTHSIGTFVANIKFYIAMSALRWTVIYVSVTRNDYGMFIIFDFYTSHVLLASNISPVKIEIALSLFSQKCNFV